MKPSPALPLLTEYVQIVHTSTTAQATSQSLHAHRHAKRTTMSLCPVTARRTAGVCLVLQLVVRSIATEVQWFQIAPSHAFAAHTRPSSAQILQTECVNRVLMTPSAWAKNTSQTARRHVVMGITKKSLAPILQTGNASAAPRDNGSAQGVM